MDKAEVVALIGAFEQADPKAVAAVVHDTLRLWIAEIWRSISEGQSPADLA